VSRKGKGFVRFTALRMWLEGFGDVEWQGQHALTLTGLTGS
jgi:hypothetical protein